MQSSNYQPYTATITGCGTVCIDCKDTKIIVYGNFFWNFFWVIREEGWLLETERENGGKDGAGWRVEEEGGLRETGRLEIEGTRLGVCGGGRG